MKQMTLFEVMNDTNTEKNNSDPAPIGGTDEEKMTPCIICGVMPTVRIVRYGYKFAKCPECGWSCGTLYNITDHWNNLNTPRWRIKRNGKRTD